MKKEIKLNGSIKIQSRSKDQLMIYSKENENGANFQKRERKKRSE
jgi:hypothetical protein